MHPLATRFAPLALSLALVPSLSAQSDATNASPAKLADSFVSQADLELPAVSQINGKLDYAGGKMNSAEGHNFNGSISVPVGHAFGFQADALYSSIDHEDFYGGAGHFFWRRPELGLVGIAGGYLQRDGVDTFQVGVEAEYYLGRFTFGGFAGVGGISYANAAPFIDTDPTRFVGRVSLNYYPVDNLRVGVSGETAYEDELVKGEVEWQIPVRGVALTAEVAAGDHGYDHWLLGVRYYFGGNKTLRDRQRQDDPPGLMPQILQGLGLYGAEFNRKGEAYLAANPGAGSLDGGGSYGVITTIYTPVVPPVIITQPPYNPGNSGSPGVILSLPRPLTLAH